MVDDTRKRTKVQIEDFTQPVEEGPHVRAEEGVDGIDESVVRAESAIGEGG